MALDNAKNFAKVQTSIGYDSTATSIVLNPGDGAKLPTAPFNIVWWNFTDFPDPSDDPNVEVVRVTAVVVDTITITRAQEGTSAQNHNTAGKTYLMVAGPTAKLVNTDIPALTWPYGQITGVPDAVADGVTKGVATFVPGDFDSLAGLIAIDYVNGQAADATHKGFLTSADWNTFNTKEDVLSFNAPLSRVGNTISIPTATSLVDGYLSAADWITFNAKVPATRLISTTAPITGGGDLSTDRTLAMAAAASGVDGYLTAVDWAAFNAKQPAGDYITAAANLPTVSVVPRVSTAGVLSSSKFSITDSPVTATLYDDTPTTGQAAFNIRIGPSQLGAGLAPFQVKRNDDTELSGIDNAGSWFTSNGTVRKLLFGIGMSLASDYGLNWSSTVDVDTARDTGLSRASAGVIEVNNGTAGTLRDLTLRHLIATDYEDATAIAAPATPGAGVGRIYVDSTSKNIAVKDDAGVVKHGVQTKASVSKNYLTAISDAGVVTAAQPISSDLSDVNGFTDGAVPYIASGALAQNTGQLFLNATDGIFSIGSATPNAVSGNTYPLLQVFKANKVPEVQINGEWDAASMNVRMTMNSYSGSSVNAGAVFIGRAIRGTVASPAATKSGDRLLFFAGSGYTNAIAGAAGAFIYRAQSDWSSTNAETQAEVWTTPSGSTSLTQRVTFKSDGSVQFNNYGAGTLTTDASGNITATSDSRLKNILGDFTRGLAELIQITPKRYTWKPESGLDSIHTYVGLIAQDLQAAIPEAAWAGPDGFLNIQDRPVVAAIINALKEINDRLIVIEKQLKIIPKK